MLLVAFRLQIARQKMSVCSDDSYCNNHHWSTKPHRKHATCPNCQNKISCGWQDDDGSAIARLRLQKGICFECLRQTEDYWRCRARMELEKNVILKNRIDLRTISKRELVEHSGLGLDPSLTLKVHRAAVLEKINKFIASFDEEQYATYLRNQEANQEAFAFDDDDDGPDDSPDD